MQTPIVPIIVNVSGYRFVPLEHLPVLQADIQSAFQTIGVSGTILLADEGINLAIAGSATQIQAARAWLDARPPLDELWLKRSESGFVPFGKLKVRIRHQIIAFPETHPDISADADAGKPTEPLKAVSSFLPPAELAAWLAEGRALTLLDTRNDYEVDSGTFEGAVHLELRHFRDFPEAARAAIADGRIDPSVPVVTFCTGGIRCERAAPCLQALGLSEVYQIEGGILNWFEQQGGRHWRGQCFVFDDRVELDANLQPTGARLCTACHRAIASGQNCSCTDDAASYSRTAIDTV